MELETTRAQLDLSKLKSVSTKPQTSASGQPCLLQATLISTPGSALESGIPTLGHLRETKKPGSTLRNNYVFSSKGAITYETLDLPDFVNGFLEFQKQQPDKCKPGLTQHLQLLVFWVTPFRINQNNNKNRAIDKVQNRRKERR